MGAAAGCPCCLIPRERCPLCRIPRTGVIALHGLLRGQRVVATMFRQRSVASGSANKLYNIAQPYSADSRDVILSRRACGVSKNLLGLPQSNRNAIMPMLRPLLSFRPKRGVKRRAERRNLSHCTHAFAMNICPCSIPSPYCHPARSFGFVPRYSLGTSLRMTGGQRCVAAAVFRESGVRSALFRERALLHCMACCADSGSVNNITLPRSVRRLRRAPF